MNARNSGSTKHCHTQLRYQNPGPGVTMSAMVSPWYTRLRGLCGNGLRAKVAEAKHHVWYL
jgi:hypothetical protein